MPMNELKADILRPDAASFNFAPADRIVDLALSNGLATRGHALLWFGATPPWMEAITDPVELERVLVRHIETVMDRYRGRVPSWDVLNEPIAFEPTDRAPLRDTSWLRVMGPPRTFTSLSGVLLSRMVSGTAWLRLASRTSCSA
ncbi:MAG: hypothetical protein EOO60_05135 [Hymenobacter sp.]|nr:MAG: hypothetical protein EOO60_05135 [Hymenobacter sp.]